MAFSASGISTPYEGAQENNQNEDIIINELLCFMANKILTLPMETICKLCSDFYPQSVIEEAKTILHNLYGEQHATRIITRRGQNKSAENVKDIYKLLQCLTAVQLKRFAAVDLSRLPPISRDYIDFSSLVTGMRSIFDELKSFKDTAQNAQLELYQKLEKLENRISNLESAKAVTSYSQAAQRRKCQDSANNPSISSNHNAETTMPQVQHAITHQVPATMSNTSKSYAKTLQSGLFIEPNNESNLIAVTSRSESTEGNGGNNPWHKVSRKNTSGKKRRFVIGTASDKSVKASDLRNNKLFVSRLALGVEMDDLQRFVSARTGVPLEHINCEKLSIKTSDLWTSAVVSVRGCPGGFKTLLNGNLWPEGVLVNKYYEPKMNKTSKAIITQDNDNDE